MKISLEGKIVLITGASRGIGKAAAKEFAAAGARVAIHYNQNRQEAEKTALEAGNGSQAFGADLGTGEGPPKLWNAVMEAMGSVDVLINNAAVAVASPFEKEDDAWLHDWGHTMMVNLNASAMLCKKAIEHFRSRDGGRIISISSRAAFRGDTADYVAYAASKGGLVSLTRSIARAFGKEGIKAFIVAPGFTRTDMAQGFIDRYGEDYAMNDIALPKLTVPEDIAPTLLFLASGLADHATGTTIDINAGSYVH